jgi:thiamine-phosphate pyrophosphorylase
MKFPNQGVYAVTDEILLQGNLLQSRVQAALESGIAVLQYRSKCKPWQTRVTEAAQMLKLCERYSVPLLINDDIDLCIETGANGVHLGQSDNSIKTARSRLPASSIIGISCHSNLQLAQKACDEGATYVALGRFFKSATKPLAPPAEINTLRLAKEILDIPIIAIGGINAENGRELIESGADLLAVIHYLFAYSNVSTRVQALNSLFASPPVTLHEH